MSENNTKQEIDDNYPFKPNNIRDYYPINPYWEYKDTRSAIPMVAIKHGVHKINEYEIFGKLGEKYDK